MTAFVTGATGFIGRFLLERLLQRDGDVHVLVRAQSVGKVEALAAKLDGGDRVKPVVGDLTAPGLGIDEAWIAEHRGKVDHVFHLAAIYDMEASEEANDAANVGGTREAVEVANALEAGCLHHVSSVAAAGSYRGDFTEAMFDEGQPLEHPYHRTKFESERIAREESTVPWRVYRPAIVVGHSQTGEMDKIDGPYYFFAALKVGSKLPSVLPVPAPRLGATNMVPVDFVADAIDHIGHQPGLDRRAFHLVDPDPLPTIDALNVFATVAGAPKLAPLLPRAAMDLPLLPTVLGVPASALDHADFTARFDTTEATKALAGSGISVPRLADYAPVLWQYWSEHLSRA